MLRFLSQVIIEDHGLALLVLNDLHAPGCAFNVKAATDTDPLNVDLSMLVLAVELQVAIHLVINLIFVLVVVKWELVTFNFDTLNVDTVLDVTSFPDSLNLSVD